MRNSPVLPLRLGGLVLAILGIFPLAAVIKYARVVEWLPGAALEWLISIPLTVGVCVAVAYLLGDRVDALIVRISARLNTLTPREFSAWTALIVLSGSAALAWYCFHGLAVTGDELTQRFQANMLLHGRASMAAEPHFEFFGTVQSATRDGRWYAQFPIGGPLLLAVGAMFNLAWLVNPLLAAWTTTSFYRFASRITDEASARYATVLFAVNPLLLLMSATQMNHTGTLALILFALAALPEWATSNDPRRIRRTAMYLGFGVAAAATVRPYDATLIAVVIGVFQLSVARDSAPRRRSLGWQVLAGLIPLAILLLANWRTTGQPFLFGYDAVNGIAHRPGFHVDPTGNDFTPIQGIHHISSYLLRLNASLLMGPLPGLVIVVVAMVLAQTANRWDYLLLGIIGVLVVGYTAYWAESFIFSAPRFLFVGLPAFILFAARMPAALSVRLGSPALRRAVLLLLPTSMVVAWVLPARAATHVGAWRTIEAARGVPALRVNLGLEADREGLSDALVFVHEPWHGRIAARLRALGAPALTAESMVEHLDACALQRALDAEDSLPAPRAKTRVNRVILQALAAGDPERVPNLPPGASLMLVGGLIPPDCLPQMIADRDGATGLDQALPYIQSDVDGHVGGRVVFVRDFGRRNVLLLDRFGDRSWYLFRPRQSATDTGPMFVPYRRANGIIP